MTRASSPFSEVSDDFLKDPEYAAIELFKLALKNVASTRL